MSSGKEDIVTASAPMREAERASAAVSYAGPLVQQSTPSARGTCAARAASRISAESRAETSAVPPRRISREKSSRFRRAPGRTSSRRDTPPGSMANLAGRERASVASIHVPALSRRVRLPAACVTMMRAHPASAARETMEEGSFASDPS